MKGTYKVADLSKFVVFILSHGRPHKNSTYKFLRSCGYTGRIIIVCDNEDETLEQYYNQYGKENVYVFDKLEVSKNVDSMNNFGKRNAILFARNACFDIAKELGYEYFQELDDDYYYFGHRRKERGKKTTKYDIIAKWFIEFLLNTNENVKTIAFSQGGDHIGGYDPIRRNYKRKCMNSWFCKTDRPFRFYGTMNDDLNACIWNGMRGGLFLTIYTYMLHQPLTQTIAGGVTDAYLKYGTYVKSFYSVMLSPSSIKIAMMGQTSPRLHHKINYEMTYPCIISEEYKKV